MKYKYEIALSFAGEDRKYVEEVAACLKANNIKVFYDEFEESNLWGKDLYVYLDEIYRKESRYCIMFLSQRYAKKLWTNHERESAQARAFQQNEEYILPVKLDDTVIPGFRPTTGYLDGKKIKPSGICAAIIKKISLTNVVDSILDDNDEDIPLIKRNISEQEKKEYLLNSYSDLKDGFRKKLEKLSNRNKHVKTIFKEKSQSKFVVIIKTDEDEVGCKIWIDKSPYHSLSILYSESYDESYESNSYNDSATVEDDGYEIYFKILGMLIFSVPNEENIDLQHAGVKDLIKYYWNRLIMNLDT